MLKSPKIRRFIASSYWVLVICLVAGALLVHRMQFEARAASLVSYARNRSVIAQSSSSTTAVPYTATLQETITKADGTKLSGGRYTWAIRSDGSRATTRALSSTSNPPTERILNFASGEQAYISEDQGTKSTTLDASVTPDNWLRNPQNNCLLAPHSATVNEHVVGPDTVNGYRAVEVTDVTVQYWYALDYGCAPIKVFANWGSMGTTEQDLVALLPGEPSAALFDIPANFKEEPPTEMFPGVATVKSDAYYSSHRPPP